MENTGKTSKSSKTTEIRTQHVLLQNLCQNSIIGLSIERLPPCTTDPLNSPPLTQQNFYFVVLVEWISGRPQAGPDVKISRALLSTSGFLPPGALYDLPYTYTCHILYALNAYGRQSMGVSSSIPSRQSAVILKCLHIVTICDSLSSRSPRSYLLY